MYFMQKNFTDVRTVRQPQDKMEYLLTGLGEYSRNLHKSFFLEAKTNISQLYLLFILFFLPEISEPFTKYKIWLKAFTWKNEGDPSQPFEMVTDVAGPSPPIITNLTCKDEKSIYLQWDKPDLVYKTIDYYYIYYRNEEQWQFKEVAVGMNGTMSKGSKVGQVRRRKKELS